MKSCILAAALAFAVFGCNRGDNPGKTPQEAGPSRKSPTSNSGKTEPKTPEKQQSKADGNGKPGTVVTADSKSSSASKPAKQDGKKTSDSAQAPSAAADEGATVFRVTRLLSELGFKQKNSWKLTFRTNQGSFSVMNYDYRNQKTSAELTLTRNLNFFGFAGPNWRLKAGDDKARQALLELAARLSPAVRKACLAVQANGEKPQSITIPEKPKSLNVGIHGKSLFIETIPPPSPFQ